MWEEMVDFVPNDYSNQVTPEWMVKRVIDKLPDSPVIVDLGCGAGNSFDFFHKLWPNCRWIGIDIGESPEVKTRTRTDVEFMEFDGVHIPLKSASVDLVFSRQVLEHVRSPEASLKDITRILKLRGGLYRINLSA